MTLPRDFSTMLTNASLEELTAVFERCEVNATGGTTRHTAIGFLDCPDELISWLVAHGLDVDAPDQFGSTPLWHRASRGRADQLALLVSLGADLEQQNSRQGTALHAAAQKPSSAAVAALLELGASVEVINARGATPLVWTLRSTRNTTIPESAEVAALLLGAGAQITESARAQVRAIAENFESHRHAFPAQLTEAVDAGLVRLHRLFGGTDPTTS